MPQLQLSPWPCFSAEEADAVSRVLLSNQVNYWTGEEGRQFEQDFAAQVGTDHAIALMNGTVALDLALRGLDIGAGDEVIVTPRSYIASVSAVVNAGAIPVFADVSRDSQNLTAETIRAAVTPNTRAILCVHLAGWPCEMDEILALAAERNLSVIEDCAQAHGATYKGRAVGGFGDVGCWSFCQDKIMTTGGEGGMVTTNDRSLWSRMWSYKDHGKSWEAVHEREHPPGFRWLHESFGTNWRMTEMQAAIGRIQLQYLGDWVERRRAHAARIEAICREFEIYRVPSIPAHVGHARYRCNVFVEPDKLAPGWSRDRILADLNADGVPCFQGICPEIYREKAFEDTPFRPAKRLPVARELGETSLSFLVHPTLTEAELEKICQTIGKLSSRAAGSA